MYTTRIRAKGHSFNKPKSTIVTYSFSILSLKMQDCYRSSIISVTVTKGGHLKGGGLYGTNKTIGRGVTKSRSYLYTKRTHVLKYLRTRRTDVLIYSVITMGRSYIFKYVVPTIR